MNPVNIYSFHRSAFFWFSNDERPKVRAANPDMGVGEVAKQLGAAWSSTPPEVRAKYEAMAENDKARYERVCFVLYFPFITELRFS